MPTSSQPERSSSVYNQQLAAIIIWFDNFSDSMAVELFMALYILSLLGLQLYVSSLPRVVTYWYRSLISFDR